MSFERLDRKDNTVREGKSQLVICNFTGKDLKAVQNFGRILGIGEQIVVSFKNGDELLKDILDNKILSSDGNGPKERALIFNNIPPAKMMTFMDNLKKLRINNILIAGTTETNIEWPLNKLLVNLIEERKALKKGIQANHEE